MCDGRIIFKMDSGALSYRKDSLPVLATRIPHLLSSQKWPAGRGSDEKHLSAPGLDLIYIHLHRIQYRIQFLSACRWFLADLVQECPNAFHLVLQIGIGYKPIGHEALPVERDPFKLHREIGEDKYTRTVMQFYSIE